MAKKAAAPTTADDQASRIASADSFFSRIKTTADPQPPRALLYGVHGVGKTVFASKAPSPIFICTEEGAEELDVPRFPRAKTREDVLGMLRSLYREQHDYKTVVIDSADWLENAVRDEVQAQFNERDLAYGKESMYMAQHFASVLDALDLVREKRRMSTIIISHSEVKRFDSPMTEPYDRYQPKLQRSVSALLQEWADAVLFAAFDVTVVRQEVGFNKEVRRGISSGDRMLYTEERPAFFAKNRYPGLPSEIPLDWETFASHVPFFNLA